MPDRPVLLYERFTGPAVTNSCGKEFFDAADAAAPVHPDIKKINVAENGAIAAAGFAAEARRPRALFLLRRMQTFDDKKRSTAGRDALLRERRADDASGPGPVPDAGPCIRLRSCRISISTGCTTRGSRCTGKAGPSSGCR